jgi:hypothetical protein
VTALRRSVLLVAAAIVTVVGLTVTPAQAGFDDTAAMATLTVGSATIAPATNVRAGALCGSWLSLGSVSWSPSPSKDVTGYTVVAYRNNGPATSLGTTNGTTTSVSTFIANGSTYSFSVTTVTSYGWMAEPARTGTIRC